MSPKLLKIDLGFGKDQPWGGRFESICWKIRKEGAEYCFKKVGEGLLVPRIELYAYHLLPSVPIVKTRPHTYKITTAYLVWIDVRQRVLVSDSMY